MMKKAIITIIFALVVSLASGQTFALIEIQNQRFGVAHAFMDDRITSEIRLNWMQSIRISPYVKAWTGTVNGYGFHSWTTKESIGARMTGGKDRSGCLMVGVAFSQFFAREVDPDNLLGKLKPLTFEAGLIVELDNRIWLMMITDPINWESCIGIGWDFTTRQRIYDRNYKIK